MRGNLERFTERLLSGDMDNLDERDPGQRLSEFCMGAPRQAIADLDRVDPTPALLTANVSRVLLAGEEECPHWRGNGRCDFSDELFRNDAGATRHFRDQANGRSPELHGDPSLFG